MSDQPWNRVVLGDGTRAILIPHASISVITEEDGHRSCNHTDATTCDRSGHETRALYDVIREGDPGWWEPAGDAV